MSDTPTDTRDVTDAVLIVSIQYIIIDFGTKPLADACLRSPLMMTLSSRGVPLRYHSQLSPYRVSLYFPGGVPDDSIRIVTEAVNDWCSDASVK